MATLAKSDASPAPRTRGLKIPPQGVGGFDRSWFPICLSTDVGPGEVIGREFMDGQIVIWRGESGTPHVQSAFCRHLGAHLKVGEVVGEHIRCAFHHWSYDGKGQCIKIAAGDTPPRDATLFDFPTRESLGLIWAFNGDEPDVELPHFSAPEDTLLLKAHHVKDMNIDSYMVFSNSMDFQHLKVVHGVELIGDLEDLEITDRGMTYSQNMKIPGIGTVRQTIRAWGTNSIALEGVTMGRKTFQMSVGCPLPGNRARIFNIDSTVKPTDAPGDAQMAEQLIQIMIDFGDRLIAEDAPVHDSMSFRHDRMAESDKYLAMYLRFARLYPRHHPAADLIAV
ncbi:aromatic ring-hydroxylating oxygenase subunit alpha [Sphingobium algorifonticola]|uniref:Rieske (2Fe-2S) protein n=1 Tax=Sphingobium algorifonticola TaxID=2008318 RepID=A0A437JA15_9SPHN|nr:Rieske (2Fe-2S) protein [Sphingobium algorifonticola]RVT42347.1 Rieske (2Fe-2S) protein [Sphingobium algorifonticola]